MPAVEVITGSNDHQVAQMRLIDRFIEAETIGNFPIGWIAQHRLSAADHDRYVLHLDMKTIEQLLRVGIFIEVNISVRITVAR